MGVKICNFKRFKKIKSGSSFKNYNELIFEEYIGGQEIQAAVINGNPLGAIELFLEEHFMIIKQSIQKKQKQNI